MLGVNLFKDYCAAISLISSFSFSVYIVFITDFFTTDRLSSSILNPTLNRVKSLLGQLWNGSDSNKIPKGVDKDILKAELRINGTNKPEVKGSMARKPGGLLIVLWNGCDSGKIPMGVDKDPLKPELRINGTNKPEINGSSLLDPKGLILNMSGQPASN